MSTYKFFCNGCVYVLWMFVEICRAKIFYRCPGVEIGGSSVVSITATQIDVPSQ